MQKLVGLNKAAHEYKIPANPSKLEFKFENTITFLFGKKAFKLFLNSTRI